MSKKYFTTTTLLIVESPAKCKKIEEYLGTGYKCIASYGHLRELKSLTNIDIENNFIPTYTIIDNPIKKRQFENIKKEIKNASEVIISSDSDREGEAIGYSIIELFNLDPQKTKRITFNEITKSAIVEAMKNPRTIDMDLVHAQQARQVLDVLVGFKLTPLLWKYITKNSEHSLSAGRCQSPALKIIYENYKEIHNSDEKKIYKITGIFTNNNICFELNSGDKICSEDDCLDFLDISGDFEHIYTCTKPEKIYKSPPKPFTTSRLQQVASNEFHYSPKETMKICQKLYEGGYITYMRTDSERYSDEFIKLLEKFVEINFPSFPPLGAKDLKSESLGAKDPKSESLGAMNPKSESLGNKSLVPPLKKVEEAHEAIRPTDISLCELPEDFDAKEKKMYKLIWENTLESCLPPASYFSITATISSINNYKYSFTSELLDFPGWKIVKNKDKNKENKEYTYLQTIKQNSIINYKKIMAKSILKGCKQHYSEARLVQLLEEKGIGRPSTFSSIVDKIQERGYVKKKDIKGKEIVCKDFELYEDEIFEIETKREFGNEKGKLVIQPLGIIVIEFLEKHFNEIINYEYTKNMEDGLDIISKGKKIWYELCKECNIHIDNLIENINNESKIEIKIDESHTYIIGKYGPVIKYLEEIDGKKNIKFLPIKKDIEIDIDKLKKGLYRLQDILDNKNIDNNRNNENNENNGKITELIHTKDNLNGNLLGNFNNQDVFLKKGKFGLYLTWGTNTRTLKELGNQPIESITFNDIIKYLEEGSNIIREVSDNISIRKSIKGDYIFFKSVKMKKPLFFKLNEFNDDYKICDIQILKSWVKDKYNIY